MLFERLSFGCVDFGTHGRFLFVPYWHYPTFLRRFSPHDKGKRKMDRRIKIHPLAKFAINKLNEYCARQWADC